jgi:hypothetical protein
VFGLDKADIKIPYLKNGQTILLSPGRYMHDVLFALIMRIANPLRLIFDISPDLFATSSEKETL